MNEEIINDWMKEKSIYWMKEWMNEWMNERMKEWMKKSWTTFRPLFISLLFPQSNKITFVQFDLSAIYAQPFNL